MPIGIGGALSTVGRGLGEIAQIRREEQEKVLRAKEKKRAEIVAISTETWKYAKDVNTDADTKNNISPDKFVQLVFDRVLSAGHKREDVTSDMEKGIRGQAEFLLPYYEGAEAIEGKGLTKGQLDVIKTRTSQYEKIKGRLTDLTDLRADIATQVSFETARKELEAKTLMFQGTALAGLMRTLKTQKSQEEMLLSLDERIKTERAQLKGTYQQIAPFYGWQPWKEVYPEIEDYGKELEERRQKEEEKAKYLQEKPWLGYKTETPDWMKAGTVPSLKR